MIPPLVRVCPNCGYFGFSRRFAAVQDGVVECPDCHHRFETVDRPWLL